jgi:hypothetical protein
MGSFDAATKGKVLHELFNTIEAQFSHLLKMKTMKRINCTVRLFPINCDKSGNIYECGCQL